MRSDTMKSIEYDLDGGEIEGDIVLVTEWTKNSFRGLPTPVKQGYTFEKWVDSGGRRIYSLDPSRVWDGIVIKACFTASPEALEDDVKVNTPKKGKVPKKAKEEALDETPEESSGKDVGDKEEIL